MRTEGQWNKGISYITPNDDVPVLLRNTYLNFGGSVIGATGYGFRDNAGVMEVKNSGGAWTVFGSGVGYTNLTQFVAQTPWRVFYSDSLGDVNELALGANGTFLKSNGAALAPSFATPAGSGDVVGPASAVNDRVVFFNGVTGKLIKDSGLTLAGNNTGDQTSIAGITGTKAQFNTAVSDGDILYVGDIVQTLDEAYNGGSAITVDTDAVTLTVPNGSNNAGLVIYPNDITNYPLALQIGANAPKVSSSTVVQYNDQGGSASDWAFNVAGGYPIIQLQRTGGTLATPLATPVGILGSINYLAYAVTNVQYNAAYIDTYLTDNAGASDDAEIRFGTRLAGALGNRLIVGQNNGIILGNALAAGVVSSNGNQDLILQTGNATTGSITIADGAAGQITLAPNAAGVVQVLSNEVGTVGAILELYQDSSSPVADDIVGSVVFYGEDTASNKQAYASVRGAIEVETSANESGILKLGVTTSGTLTDKVEMAGTSFYPTISDGMRLGSSIKQWGDLFLAEGGVINWDNGDATLTQSGDTLTLAGADLLVPDEAYGVAWNGSLEVPTKNALYDKIETIGGGATTNFNNEYKNVYPNNTVNSVPTGTVNGVNTVFYVDQAVYIAGSTEVERNGQEQTLGASADYAESNPATGEITFIVAPTTVDVFKIKYKKSVTNSDTLMYARQRVNTTISATVGSAPNTDYVYFITALHTMSLPAASGNTNRYTFKNNHSAAVTIDTVGAETIDGTASIQIAPEDAVDIISNGTNFYVV